MKPTPNKLEDLQKKQTKNNFKMAMAMASYLLPMASNLIAWRPNLIKEADEVVPTSITAF